MASEETASSTASSHYNSNDYYEPSATTSTNNHYEGFWEPHTSSVDFCESNYLQTPYVVEFHNTWSSLLGISFFGLVGLLAANPTHEWRYTMAYSILLLVGIGSAGLHGSLHWIFQSSDELPMIYLASCLNYMALEYDAPHGKPHYPWLAKALGVLAVVNTLVYYRFQEIYLVFLITYTSSVLLLVSLMYRILFQTNQQTKTRGPVAKTIGIMGMVSYLLVGSPVWILDMLQCHNVVVPIADELPGWWKGFTPHVIWHFAAGFGTYCTIVTLCCCRMEELKIPFHVKFVGGILPILLKDNQPNDEKKKLR